MIDGLVLFADLHAGCQQALMSESVTLDSGAMVVPNRIQEELSHAFHDCLAWVSERTRGGSYGVGIVGDAIDGEHHRNTAVWSSNLEDQKKCAATLIRRIMSAVDPDESPRLWIWRGTKAHDDRAGQAAESLGRELGSVRIEGRHAHYHTVLRLSGGVRLDIAHHQGVGAGAIRRCVVKEAEGASLAGGTLPDVVVRAHAHREEYCVVGGVKPIHGVSLPAWQLHTEFTHTLQNAQNRMPTVGCAIVTSSDGVPVVERWSRQIVDVDEVDA